MTDKRWTVRLYDKDGKLVSEADFGTKKEAEECRDEIAPFAKEAGGRVEVEGPEEG